MPVQKLQPNTFALTMLLTLLVSFGPLSVDLYVPSMPEVARMMNAPGSQVQLTISFYLAGFALGQILYGPISDRFGRKPAIIGAFLIYCAATILCLVSTDIDTLVTGRFLQGLGVSGSSVVARAVVRDLYEGTHATLQFSTMNMFMGLMPIFAPLMGGVLATFFGWHSVFIFQCCAGVATVLLVVFRLPESHVGTRVSPLEILRSYGHIIVNRSFLANTAIGMLAYSGLFAWIVGSPFVMQTIVGLSPLNFSFCYAAACSGFIVGGWIGTRLVVSHGLNEMAGIGAAFCAVAGLCILASAAIGVALPVTLTLPMGIYFIGLAILLAQSTAAALMPFPKQAGTASSLLGFMQQLAGVIMGTLVGRSLDKSSALPMGMFVAASGCGALLLWFMTRRVRTVTHS
jgi:DHA1 family bicyclomycin/chloramphenicol resistance-like MFS transporter